MRAIFVGLGSIGARHLKNLRNLCESRSIPLHVAALRSTKRPLPNEVAALVDEELLALPEGAEYDLAFITNPTSLHAFAIGQLKDSVTAFFIEKPVFDHPDYELEPLGLGPGQKAYVAAPMRHTALYAAVKQQLAGGLRAYSARALCSSYLPDWRPNADYRTGYSAQRALGGGVTLDLIHEWDYLYDLFGAPQETHALKGHYSHLEIDSDDLSVYIARWPQLLGEVHLDYFGRGYRRTLELFCETGSLVADFGAGTLTLPNGTQQTYAEEANRRFEREMDYFVNYALAGTGESLNSPARALAVLQIALGAHTHE